MKPTSLIEQKIKDPKIQFGGRFGESMDGINNSVGALGTCV